jgi:hypothetical protein
MKVVVLCTSDGEITSVASMPDGGPPVSFRNADPRSREIVIEAQDLTEAMSSSEVIDRLVEIRARQRVKISERKFVPK